MKMERIMKKQTKHKTAVYCPRCEAMANAACAAGTTEASDRYGIVSEEEYEKLQKKRERKMWSYSMLEEYLVGTGTDGSFVVEYTAECSDCGFKHMFRHEEQLAVFDCTCGGPSQQPCGTGCRYPYTDE